MRALRTSPLCLALGFLLSSAPAFADGIIHHVSVGGPDQDAVDHTDANFSLVANQHADGTVTGEWTDQFGQGEGGIHAQVDCVLVEGNKAWVSGTITSGTVGGVDVTGLPVVTLVQDNGKSANDPPDEISFSFIANPARCTDKPDLPLNPMTGGQVTVR